MFLKLLSKFNANDKIAKAFASFYEKMEDAPLYGAYCQEVQNIPFNAYNMIGPQEYDLIKKIYESKTPFDLGMGNGAFKTLNPNIEGIDLSNGQDLNNLKFDIKYKNLICIDSFYNLYNYKILIKEISKGDNFYLFHSFYNNRDKFTKYLEQNFKTIEVQNFTEQNYEMWKHSEKFINKLDMNRLSQNEKYLINIKLKETKKQLALHEKKLVNRVFIHAQN